MNVISDNALNTNVIKIIEEWVKKKSQWLRIIEEVSYAQNNLLNRQFIITVKRKEPTFSLITFSYDKLTRFDHLKTYCGDYGFVVPVMVSPNTKVLRGEKKKKY